MTDTAAAPAARLPAGPPPPPAWRERWVKRVLTGALGLFVLVLVWLIVEPPSRTRPARKFRHIARAMPHGSMPIWRKKRRSSIATKAWPT